jgi:hypothetical protein
VYQHVAEDHRGRDGAVVAGADQAGPQLVLLRIAPELLQGALLVQRRRQLQRAVQADGRRHRLYDQVVEAGDAQGLEHAPSLRLVGAEMAAQEGIGLVQLGQRRAFRHGLDLDRECTIKTG